VTWQDGNFSDLLFEAQVLRRLGRGFANTWRLVSSTRRVSSQFEDAFYFADGQAQLKIGARYALVDAEGTMIWKWDEGED